MSGQNMSNEKIIGTYLLHNQETGQAYVGSGDLDSRKRRHLYELKNNKHINKKLQEAYNENPNFDFIGVPVETREEAFDVEQDIIDSFISSILLLNKSRNARHCVIDMSQETKDKISKANKGILLSEEHKAKLSIAQKESEKAKEHMRNLHTLQIGTKHSLERIEKIRLGNLGKTVTDENKEKLRIFNTGRKTTEETKLKQRNAKLGKPLSEEHCLNLSLVKIGKPLSDKHKENIKNSEACKNTLEKMRLSNIGRVKSPETIAKMLKTRQENKNNKLKN